MKFFKKIAAVLTVGALIFADIAPVEAAQPVTYTLGPQCTNSITSATAATPTTNIVPAGTFVLTNLLGTANMTNFDSLLQSQFTLYAWAVPNVIGAGAGAGVSGTLQFNCYVSPDGLQWWPYTNAPAITLGASTNVYSTLVTNFNSGWFRYLTVSNIVSTVTNAFFTNSINNTYEATNGGGITSSNGGGWGLKIFYKLP